MDFEADAVAEAVSLVCTGAECPSFVACHAWLDFCDGFFLGFQYRFVNFYL